MHFSRRIRLLLGLLPMVAGMPVLADELYLYVQPIASESETIRIYTPLADYLSIETGRTIRVRTELNFLTYWERMRRDEDFHLVLDAAHFTDFRVKQRNYEVLAKIPDTVSFSLVTSQDLLLFDAEELIGQSIASAPSPSLGGVRMAELFPNPLRQPNQFQADNFQLALDKLHKGEIKAALVPTPMVNRDNTVNTVLTTKPVPHMALSASPRLEPATRQAIRQALLNASKNPKGQAMLQAINISHFEAANNAVYNGYADLLQGVWGYESN